MIDYSKFIVTGRLSKREVETLKKDMSLYSSMRADATVVNQHGDIVVNDTSRKSTLFFPKAHDFPNTFNILQSTIIGDYSGKVPFISLNDIAEIQYARYDKGDYFKRHRDVIKDASNTRRTFTFSINLSEADDYGDGELVVYDDDDNEVGRLDKSIGSFIVFPSFFLHEAMEVSSGVREAIVCWIYSDVNTHNRFFEGFYKNEL